MSDVPLPGLITFPIAILIMVPVTEICDCLYPGALWTVVSVPSYAQGASPTQYWCRQCWNGSLNNYQKERIPHPGPSSKTALYLPFWFLEVACQVRRTQFCPETVLPEVEKAAGTQAHGRRGQNPQLLQLGYFLGSEQCTKSPGKLEKMGSTVSEGPNGPKRGILSHC